MQSGVHSRGIRGGPTADAGERGPAALGSKSLQRLRRCEGGGSGVAAAIRGARGRAIDVQQGWRGNWHLFGLGVGGGFLPAWAISAFCVDGWVQRACPTSGLWA